MALPPRIASRSFANSARGRHPDARLRLQRATSSRCERRGVRVRAAEAPPAPAEEERAHTAAAMGSTVDVSAATANVTPLRRAHRLPGQELSDSEDEAGMGTSDGQHVEPEAKSDSSDNTDEDIAKLVGPRVTMHQVKAKQESAEARLRRGAPPFLHGDEHPC